MKAAIDIGTNTVLLLVAEIKNGQIIPVHEEHRVPRLGKGVDANKNINAAATNRVIEALLEYQRLLKTDFPETESLIVTATSAVRDAKNRDAFIQKVKDKTGFEIQLLSGNEEAQCTAAGALSVLPSTLADELLILDIGGGSTEVAQVSNGTLMDEFSFDMGSVRFTERFLNENPPSKKEIESCRNAVKQLYNSRRFTLGNKAEAVGVAGTLTTLAGLVLDLKNYQPDKLNGVEIQAKQLTQVIHDFEKQPYEKMLAQNPVFLKGREDIFLAGLLILEGFLNEFNLNQIMVSTGGIRHGAIISL